jgi:hypothetical protein
MNIKIKKPIHFTHIRNDIINKIKDLNALGIYAYLCSITNENVISYGDLQSRFHCDSKQIETYLRYLLEIGVLEGESI